MKAPRASVLHLKRVRIFWVSLLIILVILESVSISLVGAVEYSQTQHTGLQALYNATSGEQWTSSTGWRGATLGVCSWYGVTCDSSGENVTTLSLVDNGLAGNLTEAAELFDILSLQEIDLSNNELFGPVALGFGLMPNLKVLDLSRNNLSSLPASWGSEASSLQHLLLQLNNISGTLPFAWLDVNSSTSYPLLHYTEASHWLPKLRTLSLGSNNIDMTVYRALQSIVGFSSLQALDLSHNALTGELRGSFDRYYCEGGGLNACNSAVVKTGASLLAIVLLASNFIEGGLKVEALPRSLTVFTVSDNLLQGPVPEDYSQLSAFFAEGNQGLNGTELPSFASYANSSAETVRFGNLSCPIMSGQYSNGGSMRLGVDPSYLEYAQCACVEGMEGNSQDGCQLCPAGTYRGTTELFNSRSCFTCPADAGTITTGAESISQCKCKKDFYDILAGVGDSGPSCSACPYDGIGWEEVGAISLMACSCPAGRYLNQVAETCTECTAGSYKSTGGNGASLCVPCPKGTYSALSGGTHSDICTPCEAGTFSVSTGATSSSLCIKCPSGTYSASTGLLASDLCGKCPAGYYLEDRGATNASECLPCPRGTYSTEIGASSKESCELCNDGQSSLGGSHVCDLSLANSRKTLVIYLIVGASTLAAICITYYTWQKKVHKKKKLTVDSRTETPLKMARAKRKAHSWAVFFHTLETIDVIMGNTLFAYLIDVGAIQGLMQYVYWFVVSMGVVLNVYRLYKVLWMKCLMKNVSVAHKVDKEGKRLLVVHMPGSQRQDRWIMTPDDAKMVLELVKILKHLQVNKFKVQLAVVMDLPLTFLNLYLLWKVEPGLIQSPLFLTSLIINVFSAGKISTLIEYHLELRQRKRKLERLLLLELKSSKGGSAYDHDILEAETSVHEQEDDCFEQGDPETLLKFHGQSMRNIATKEAQDSPPPFSMRKKARRYLQLSPSLLSPKRRIARKHLRVSSDSGRGLGQLTPPWRTRAPTLGGSPEQGEEQRLLRKRGPTAEANSDTNNNNNSSIITQDRGGRVEGGSVGGREGLESAVGNSSLLYKIRTGGRRKSRHSV